MSPTKTIGIMTPIILGICFLVTFSKPQPAVTQIPQTTSTTVDQRLMFEKTVNTQRRFNRYFQKDVGPKLKECWARIKGRGTIEIKYSYRKDASGKWIADRLAVSSSTLPRGQELIALQCMQDSVRGTNLPSDSNETTYTLYWNWTVPFSPIFPQAATEISANGLNGGEGCDGNGAPARCWLCSRSGCRPACFGGEACRTTPRSCRVVGDCGTGGIYGVAGKIMIQ